MSPLTIALISFGCIFASALLGLSLRTVLPEHHLQGDSKDVVKLGTGLIATLAALVLGLLVSSAKSSFDTMNAGLMQAGAKIISLDRILAHYGPETDEAREQLRRSVASALELNWLKEKIGPAGADIRAPIAGIEPVQDKMLGLSPQSDSQRLLQSQALQVSTELAHAHWQLLEETQSPLPTAFLVVLVSWLAILFLNFGLLAPRNATVIGVLLVTALSASGAIFLILEMSHPLQGIIRISNAPLHKALLILGR